MSDFKKTLTAIDDAVGAHIKSNRKATAIVTGWVLVASISDVEDPESDGYILQASARLPHHTQVGLLNMALDDKKNLSILATMRAIMGGS